MTASPALVQGLVLAEAAILVIVVLLMTITTAFGERLTRLRRAAREEWLMSVRPRFEADDGSAEGADPGAGTSTDLSRSRRRQIATVSGLTRSLAGATVERALAGAGHDRMVDAARRWCSSRLWWRRLRGVRTLTTLGITGASGVDLTALLDDENPEVRAEAAAAVVGSPVTRRTLERLVAMLDGDAWGRWAAADALLRIGEPAVEPLAVHLERGARRPQVGLRVAAGLGSSRLLPATLPLCHDRRATVRAAAADAVAAVGGQEAAAMLLHLLDDDAPVVREAAARGLGTLEHWPAAAALAGLLRDPVWEVRRSAAQALRALGPVGRLHLRRAAEDADPDVAQIARHVSDLPDSAIEQSR